MKHIILLLIFVLSLTNDVLGGRRGHPIDPKKMVGNVWGYVKDEQTSLPIKDADVFLITPSKDYLKEVQDINSQAVWSNNFVPKRITDTSGKFLINFVPTPDSGKSYSLFVVATGYESQLIDSFFVPCGALMPPTLSIKLKQGGGSTRVVQSKELDSTVIVYGSNCTVKTIQVKKKGLSKTTTIGAWIYATDEDHVGGTTANGHVITYNDYFCALPSNNVLCWSDQTNEFTVNLYYGNNSQINVPVWETGPWNIHDNYWDTDDQRDIYQHLTHGGTSGLGQYVPEAEATHSELIAKINRERLV